ncbi:MAG TPA: LptF/LptG family permease, partial [Pyrinomonadaceae bacterium]|nr:LptF/LptG family permease [Pyrinomonadaceae bacterium]
MLDFATGIRDLDLVIQLSRFFALSVVFVSALFLVFTAFELWKFAGNSADGISLLFKYLFFLLPYIFLQIAPTAVLIAVVATLVTKSRQHEFVTWAAAGQSAYRALVPCLIFSLAVGIVGFAVQEGIAPMANRAQDSLRAQIRSGGSSTATAGRAWAAGNGRIYSFKVGAGVQTRPSRTLGLASDNDTRFGLSPQLVAELSSASDNETAVSSIDLKGSGGWQIGTRDRNNGLRSREQGIDWKILGFAGLGMQSAMLSTSGLIAQNSSSSASDNETSSALCSRCPTDLLIYEFDATGLKLQTVYRSESAKF